MAMMAKIAVAATEMLSRLENHFNNVLILVKNGLKDHETVTSSDE